MKLPFLNKQPNTKAAPPAPPGSTPTPGHKAPPAAVKKSPLDSVEKGMTSIIDIIAPSSIEVDFRYIRVGETFHTTLFIAGYPRYVSPGWLTPIIDYDHTMDISMFCYPTSSSDVLADLKRKIGEMQATLSSDAEAGKVTDPTVEAALEDALGLQEELAKGIERFFQFGFYITVSAPELPELQQTVKELQTTLSSLLLAGKTATLQMEEGFKSSLPLGQDRLYVTRNMDTSSLASTFPFTSAILTQNKGVMYGVNQQNGSLIIFDRFSLENANEVVLGKSGAGKSYAIKLEIARQFMLGAEVIVIDPEGEYGTMAPVLGGEVVDFSSSSEIKINPFDLSDVYEEGENELGLKILSLHGLLKLITGDLDAEHDAILDRALIECYRQKGITTDPATQRKEPPLMEDLYKTLLGMETQPSKDLAFRLEKFIKGSAAGIFNQQSNFEINNPLTIFSIRNLEEELRPVAMHIILDFVWTKVKKTLKKRILILDEGWYMMKYQDSASFVYSIAKRARKYYLGMTTATQDVEDFLKNEYGKAVLTNSSIQILLKQGTAEVDMIANTFYLSEGEKALLLSSDVGEGLFFAGQNHVAMKVFAAPFEHELITSNPMELLKRQEDAQAVADQAQAEAATAPGNTTTSITTDMNKLLETPPPAEQAPKSEPNGQAEPDATPPNGSNEATPTSPSENIPMTTPPIDAGGAPILPKT
jgi:conjugal transfer ATP-binding protein TraC